MAPPIYLDYNGTTPLDPHVIEAMAPFLETEFGNPSSSHWYGIVPKKAVETARRQVAELLDCNPGEIIFTSGGTESNNHAIMGVARAYRAKGNHIITNRNEDQSVEKILGIEVPERAIYIRVIANELNRIASHLVSFGCFGLDMGAFTPFLYGFREREHILDLFDRMAGHDDGHIHHAGQLAAFVSCEADCRGPEVCRRGDAVEDIRRIAARRNGRRPRDRLQSIRSGKSGRPRCRENADRRP